MLWRAVSLAVGVLAAASCVSGDVEPTELEMAIEYGADSVEEYLTTERSQDELDSGLFKAVAHQDMETLQVFLDAGADPTVEHGGDSLFVAIASGREDRVDLAEFVLDLGADICAISDRSAKNFGSLANRAQTKPDLSAWLEAASAGC